MSSSHVGERLRRNLRSRVQDGCVDIVDTHPWFRVWRVMYSGTRDGASLILDDMEEGVWRELET